MHISATPNPFEQLTKSNRVRAKTKDRTGFGVSAKSKLVGYHAEADILLDRRSSILAKIASNEVESIPPESKGFQYFYSSENDISTGDRNSEEKFDQVLKQFNQTELDQTENSKVLVSFIEGNQKNVSKIYI